MPFIQNLPDGIFIQECNEFDGWSRQDLLDEIKRLKIRINELDGGTNLNRFENRVYSQNGEDGILLKLVELLYEDTKDKNYVELGVENGTECNTRILRENSWNGLQLDGGHENLDINLRKEFITKENVNELLRKYDVPSHIHCLSVDIDFNDFYCLQEILRKYTCDIIICEYNATHLPNEDKVVPYIADMAWEKYQTNFFGVSLLTLNKLCASRGYKLVCCDSMGVNAFFVREKLLKQMNVSIKHCGDVERLYQKPKYGTGPNGGHRQDPKNREYLSYTQVERLTSNVDFADHLRAHFC